MASRWLAKKTKKVEKVPAAGGDDGDRPLDLGEQLLHGVRGGLHERAVHDPVHGTDPGLAHGIRDVGVGDEREDDVARVGEDLAGVAVVGVHVEGPTGLAGEGVVTGAPGLREVAPRRLRGVADDGP